MILTKRSDIETELQNYNGHEAKLRIGGDGFVTVTGTLRYDTGEKFTITEGSFNVCSLPVSAIRYLRTGPFLHIEAYVPPAKSTA